MASSSTSRPLGNDSSSFIGERDGLPHQQWEQPPEGGWDIFISHSGVQKGFAKDLYNRLYPPYNVFFDITRPSLPPGENFPDLIFQAAKTCRLALVVLSNEFFCYKWPMLELAAFIDAMPSSGVKVLPLFYEISPKELKVEKKLQEWRKIWEEIASKDSRIKLSLWTDAFRKLCSTNGLVFEKIDGTLAYLDKIESAIYEMIPPLFRSSHGGVHGRDRLCKVFIDKFEELEQRPQHPSTDLSRVYVLGVHGLPGSGKTTLCACLRDLLSSTFAGKVLHLNLPMNPTPAELLRSAKELFKLTDFGHNREKMLSEIVDLPRMYDILRFSNLQRTRVFLAIDNISSQDSIESVAAFLRLGVGAGSRVMLVARTLEILSPLLEVLGNLKSHIRYVCDSLSVPSISEAEAIRVLMQPAGGLGILAPDHSEKMEEVYNLTPSHKEILVKVARMCAFRDKWHQDLVHLPLALKIIGSQLRSNGVDLEKWNIQLSQLDTTMVEEFKEDAVKKIVDESYQKLSDELQLLFLDVALFMVPYCQFCIKDELHVELLGFMHECRPDTIKRKVNDLNRLCFLELGYFNVVHDVFLEFARSIPEASSMYYCRKRNITGLQVKSELSLMAVSLRALILELDEECKRFDFPEGLSRVKVVVVRECKSLEVLGLASLKSLVSLEIQNCPRLRVVDLDPGHSYPLKSLRWRNGGACIDVSDQCQQESFQRSLLEILQAGSGMPFKWLLDKVWCNMLALGRLHHRPPLNGFMNLARQLKALQVLRLQRTDITSLGDLSSCWPQLRVLEVLEGHLEVLELGNLPKLKQFFYGDSSRIYFEESGNMHIYDLDMRSDLRMLRNPNLLAGCPELEDVRISKPCYEDGMGTLILPPNLRCLYLRCIYSGEPELSDLASAAHSLEKILVCTHHVLQRIVFTCQFLRLVRMRLYNCPNLIRINGLEWLPNLQELTVHRFAKLQSVGNLEASRMLQTLLVSDCPVLSSLHLDFKSSLHLEAVIVEQCPNVQFLASDLEHLTAVTWELRCNVVGHVFKLRNLANLWALSLEWKCEGQGTNPLSLCCYDVEEANCEQAQLQHMKHIPLLILVGESAAPCLKSLELVGAQNLVSLEGADFFRTLRHLRLEHLPKLTCLQALESLTNLCTLQIRHCPAVTEVPSLCSLVKLRKLLITHCANLVLFKGCLDMTSLGVADFERCESLEHLELKVFESGLEHLDLSKYGSEGLRFRGCKFASIKAMLRWVLDEKVSRAWRLASLEALTWELTDNLLEKPKERMELAEQLVETLGVYLMKTLPALTHSDDCFDFQWWVDVLRDVWRDERKGEYPRELEKLMEGLGRVPLRDVLQKCQSDAHFRTSVANCLIESHSGLLYRWIARLVSRHTSFSFYSFYPFKC